MTEGSAIGTVQGSINEILRYEILRLLLPGYFALFLFFTLYPDVFDGKEFIFVLGGGVLFGLLIHGLNFHKKHIRLEKPFKLSFNGLQNEENDKLLHMLNILKKSSLIESERAIEQFIIGTSGNDKENNTFKKMYFLFTCFSYGDVPNTIRERQRLYASLFYLYVNSYWLLIIYLSLFIIFYPVLLTIDKTSILINIIPYYYDIRVNIFIIFIVIIFIYLLWKNANDTLDNSMWFQKIFMKYYKNKLIRNVGNVIKWDYDENV